MIYQTIFVSNDGTQKDSNQGILYTPQESISEIIFYGRRITNLHFQDKITHEGITRTILFDWYKEPEVKPDLFNQK